MATLTAASPSKKRSACDTAPVNQLFKRAATDATWPVAGSTGGIPGWQYPPLPMGMIPPMPYCMPGNPFFPFMGIFPPFWLPAAAMAAATMPALAAASAANAGIAATVSSMPCATTMPPNAAAMWNMLPNAAGAQPVPCATGHQQIPACTSSGVSSAAAIPSASCTNSVPTVGIVQSPPSPPPQAASPVSVCNDGVQQEANNTEDIEFATFIDSFLLSEGEDLMLAGSGGDAAEPSVSGEKILPIADLLSPDGGNSSDIGTEEGFCLPHSDSHSLLNLLGADEHGLSYL